MCSGQGQGLDGPHSPCGARTSLGARWHSRDWSHEPTRKTTPDGVEFALWSRVDAVDEHDRCVHMTIRAQTSDGRREEHEFTMRQWYREELVPVLKRTGFAAIEVNDERTLVYVASRHGD